MSDLVLGPKKSNPAKRIRAVVAMLSSVPDKQGNKDLVFSGALARAFGYEDAERNEQHILSTQLLRQLYGQVQLMQLQLSRTGLSPELFRADISSLLNHTTPGIVSNQWQSVKNHLVASSVQQTLAWAEEVLPEDGAQEGDVSAINETLGMLAELRKLLAAPDLEAEVRHFVEPRLRELELAFRAFPVCGKQLLAEEVDKVSSAIRRQAPEFEAAVREAKSNPGRALMQGLGRGIKRAAEVSETFNSLHDAAANAIGLVKRRFAPRQLRQLALVCVVPV